MKMVIVKEAEIHLRAVKSRPVMLSSWRTKRFSVDEARRALPYLSRIVRDAVGAYHEAQRWRRRLEEPWPGSDTHGLAKRRDSALQQLNSAIDECNAVGADLVDFELGVVRFGAEVEGRGVSLFWRLGEPISGAWMDACPSHSCR